MVKVIQSRYDNTFDAIERKTNSDIAQWESDLNFNHNHEDSKKSQGKNSSAQKSDDKIPSPKSDSHEYKNDFNINDDFWLNDDPPSSTPEKSMKSEEKNSSAQKANDKFPSFKIDDPPGNSSNGSHKNQPPKENGEKPVSIGENKVIAQSEDHTNNGKSKDRNEQDFLEILNRVDNKP